MGPLPTTLAPAGIGPALDCCGAAPGPALWASAPAQLPTSNAAASFNKTFFIGILASLLLSVSCHKERLEISLQRGPDLGLMRIGNLPSAPASAAGRRSRRRI